MKSINFYYIYDNIGETVIGDKPFFAPNDLSAAICFRDSFITNKKSQFNYEALDLVKFAKADINPDGEYLISLNEKDVKTVRWTGKEIMSFISEQCAELGINDNLIEDEEQK